MYEICLLRSEELRLTWRVLTRGWERPVAIMGCTRLVASAFQAPPRAWANTPTHCSSTQACQTQGKSLCIPLSSYTAAACKLVKHRRKVCDFHCLLILQQHAGLSRTEEKSVHSIIFLYCSSMQACQEQKKSLCIPLLSYTAVACRLVKNRRKVCAFHCLFILQQHAGLSRTEEKSMHSTSSSWKNKSSLSARPAN